MGAARWVGLWVAVSATLTWPSASSEPDPAPFVVADGPGDVQTATGPSMNVPGATFVDLLEFRIENEDPVQFDLVWKLASFGSHTGTFPRSGFLRLAAWFHVEPLGDLQALVFARVSVEEWGGFGFGDSDSGLCRATGFEDCWDRSFPFRFDTVAHEVRATLSKDRFPRTPEGAVPELPQGTPLRGVAAGVRFDAALSPATREPALPFLVDLSSGPAKDYAMRAPQANQALRFQSGPGERRDAAFTVAGVNQSFALNLSNPTPLKQLVTLTYDLDAPSGWSAGGPRAVSVPSHGNRTFSYWIHAPVDAAPFTKGLLRITADSLLDPGLVAYQPVAVEAANRLTPETPRLYLHADASSCYVENDPTPHTLCTDGDLSSFADDPRRPDPDEVSFDRGIGILAGSEAGRGFDTDHPLGTPVQVEKGEVHLRLKLRAERDIRGADLSVVLNAEPVRGAGVELLRTTLTQDVSTAGTTIDVRATPKLSKPLLLPRGSSFWFRATLTYPEAAPGVADIPRIWAVGTESFVDLPISLPRVDEAAPPAGPFQTFFVGDDQLHVNPGEHAAFRLSVLNQDLVARRATVTAATNRTDFGVEVRPAAAFDLEPGQGIVVGVLTSAPTTAAEGERVNVTITVADEFGQTLRRTGLLLVIQQVDVADALAEYQDDGEAKARAVAPPKGRAPGTEVASVLAWATLFVSALRRRSAQFGPGREPN